MVKSSGAGKSPKLKSALGKGLGKGLGALVHRDVASTIKINIDDISPNPYQPRKHFQEDALDTLVSSIRQHGLVQPIIVRKVGEKYELVAGERRWRACKELKMDQIEAIVKDYSTEQTTEIALVENLQRQDLDPIEEAYAYRRLMDTFKLTQEDISAKLGRSRSHIANMVRLLNLCDAVKNELSAGEITIGQARPLLALKSGKEQEEALQVILDKELNARQVEALVRQMSRGGKSPSGKAAIHGGAEVRAWADRLKLSLGTPVDIRFRAGKAVKGRIEIQFSSEEELERLLTYLDDGHTMPGNGNMDSKVAKGTKQTKKATRSKIQKEFVV